MAELLLEAHHRHQMQGNAQADARDARGNDAAAAAVAWLKQPRSERQQYPLNVTVDFTQLRANALRRYMAFHGIQEIPGSSKDQLAIVVARHFNEECKLTDEETSIASFLSYIKGARVEADTTSDSVTSEPAHEDDYYAEQDKENSVLLTNVDMLPGEDYGHQQSQSSSDDDDDDDDDMDEDGGLSKSPSVKRSRAHGSSPSTQKHRRDSTSKSSSSSSSSNKGSKKKRKTRLYCVCKGASFGNMIACDNRKCHDRSNWYHMGCVDLDPSEDPPETWFCPNCVEKDADDVPENQYRKPVASVTYGDMISHALTALPSGKGSFKDICDFVEKQYESQLNWKLESDQRKSPVWKSSVRKILFSNVRFRKHPDDKGVFTLAA